MPHLFLYLLLISSTATAYETSDLPKAYRESLGSFRPQTKPPKANAKVKRTPLQRLMNPETPLLEPRNETLKGLLNEEKEPEKTKKSAKAKESYEWQTHKLIDWNADKKKKRKKRRWRKKRRKRN